jgi:hypothetical protein
MMSLSSLRVCGGVASIHFVVAIAGIMDEQA